MPYALRAAVAMANESPLPYSFLFQTNRTYDDFPSFCAASFLKTMFSLETSDRFVVHWIWVSAHFRLVKLDNLRPSGARSNERSVKMKF